jgi:hypothetical protein
MHPEQDHAAIVVEADEKRRVRSRRTRLAQLGDINRPLANLKEHHEMPRRRQARVELRPGESRSQSSGAVETEGLSGRWKGAV